MCSGPTPTPSTPPPEARSTWPSSSTPGAAGWSAGPSPTTYAPRSPSMPSMAASRRRPPEGQATCHSDHGTQGGLRWSSRHLETDVTTATGPPGKPLRRPGRVRLQVLPSGMRARGRFAMRPWQRAAPAGGYGLPRLAERGILVQRLLERPHIPGPRVELHNICTCSAGGIVIGSTGFTAGMAFMGECRGPRTQSTDDDDSDKGQELLPHVVHLPP